MGPLFSTWALLISVLRSWRRAIAAGSALVRLCYLHPSLDYYVFVVFSWLVWQPLAASWGYYGLRRVANAFAPYWGLYPHLGGWPAVAYFPWLADPKFRAALPALGGLGDPSADLDLTTSTDSEDLAVFAADLVEFGEQEATLLTDALFDLGGGAFFGGAAFWAARRTLAAARARRRR